MQKQHTVRIVARKEISELTILSLGAQHEATPSVVILFGGERWYRVERVALLDDEQGQRVGVATLAPTNELGGGGPHIIGVWVAPPARRQGHGLALLCALSQESQRLYGVEPTIVTATLDGAKLAKRAVDSGVALHVIVAGGNATLP